MSDSTQKYFNLLGTIYTGLLQEYKLPNSDKRHCKSYPFKLSNDKSISFDENIFSDELLQPVSDSKKSYIHFYLYRDEYENAFMKNCIIKMLSEQFLKYIMYNDEKDDENIIKYFSELFNNRIKIEVNTVLFNQLELFIELSNTKYEKNVCNGYLVLDKRLNSEILISISNDNDKIWLNVENIRMIRKLLESTSEDTALLILLDSEVHKYYVSGFVKNNINAGTIYVNFCGYRNFKVYKNEKLLIEYSDNKFCGSLPIRISDKDNKKLYEILKNKGKVDAVKELMFDISKLGNKFHGSIIVFTNDIDFIDRMYKHERMTKVYNSKELNLFDIYKAPSKNRDKRNAIKILSCVDGAIVLDLEGNIISFGTILDGKVMIKGQKDRGSRFNSAKTYVDYYTRTNEKGYLYRAIVLSEDGYVDVF